MSRANETCRAIGARAAKSAFDRRSAGRAARNVEVHLTEVELAAMLALAAQAGFEAAFNHPLGIATPTTMPRGDV